MAGGDESDSYTVSHVIDGDTISVKNNEGEETKVRFLNIDTPEMKSDIPAESCYGQEAKDFLEKLLPPSTIVRLETDEVVHDRYGRTLAGVFLEDDLVNARIAQEGFGKAMLVEPNRKFYEQVLQAEEVASDQQKGIHDPTLGCSPESQLKSYGEALTGSSLATLSDEELDAHIDAIDEAFRNLDAFHVLSVKEGEDGSAIAKHFSDKANEEIDPVRRNLNDARTQAVKEKHRRLEEAKQTELENTEQTDAEDAQEQTSEVDDTVDSSAGKPANGADTSPNTSQYQAPPPPDTSGNSESDSESSAGIGGGVDTYTGCRAYGGGYTPNAVDDQGRPYTRIDCATKVPI
ncbi:thermonuclease family protein [Corynebacterium sp. H78]|uniref:thermonuclease family protein n=1 Tax=Corynebacterium sp. H78 TaxID=3133417 RepID=UPI0030B7F05C